MSVVSCPECGETERLTGERDGDVIRLTCGACAASWPRDVRKRCGLCGSDNLKYTPKPLWEKGRGEQRTPAGRIDAYYCYDCGGRDVTSADPIPEGA